MKEGWCVGLGQERVEWGWRSCLKYLKSGWNNKERTRSKEFRKRGKLGQGVGALKRGMLEPTYELWRGNQGKSVDFGTIEYPKYPTWDKSEHGLLGLVISLVRCIWVLQIRKYRFTASLLHVIQTQNKRTWVFLSIGQVGIKRIQIQL